MKVPVRTAVAACATLLVAASTVGTTAAAQPAKPRLSRGELEGIQASVETAVSRVSRPAGLMFGRGSRSYHLKGYGAVVVLAPRALPRVRRFAASSRGPGAIAFDDVVRDIEKSVAEVRDPAERRRLQEAIAALKSAPPPRAPLPPPVPGPRAMPPRDIEAFRAQAEAFRREAERAMERAERDVLVRLRFQDDVMPPVPPPPPGAPAVAPPAVPAVPPVPPLPPGWPFGGFEFERGPGRPEAMPEQVLADVRGAIVSGLGAYRGDLSALAADEFVVVAVDFVSGVGERSPAQTVVARVLQKDLAAHRAGRLGADAFRGRVEFDDY